MPANTGCYIGLMSGTSADAVDAVLLCFDYGKPVVAAHHSQSISKQLRQQITQLSFPGEDNLDLLGETDRQLGILFAEAANALIAQNNTDPSTIAAIGSHGQTVRHRPESSDNSARFSLQIGDPNTIATLTGITTVADFRRKDIALGGEAAPLVPAFHKAAFQHETLNRAIINIGGIANITWLPAQAASQPVIGFDTGPGNCLMDSWIQTHQGKNYDDEGNWGAKGNCQYVLLKALLEHPFINRPWPKSTGKEMFNQSWLESLLTQQSVTFTPQDTQATLAQFTAMSIAQGLKQLPTKADEIYLCGGGVHNRFLISCLQQSCPSMPVKSSLDAGIDPMHVEAAAFAWLAHQTMHQLCGSLASVTGAARDSILGGIYLPG